MDNLIVLKNKSDVEDKYYIFNKELMEDTSFYYDSTGRKIDLEEECKGDFMTAYNDAVNNSSIYLSQYTAVYGNEIISQWQLADNEVASKFLDAYKNNQLQSNVVVIIRPEIYG